MSILFKVAGRNQSYMPVELDTPKDQILNLQSRHSFSTNSENEWPYDSPEAGYYDINNSSTKMILLNNKKTWSHLRGKTSARRETQGKDSSYSWVEQEQTTKTRQEAEANNIPKSAKSRKKMNPERHFSANGVTTHRTCDLEDSSLNSDKFKSKSSDRFGKTAINFTMDHRNVKMTKEEEDELIAYLIRMGKRTTGLQNKSGRSWPPSEYHSSYNLNHPSFNRDQRLYMTDKCNAYSCKSIKSAHKQRYVSALEKQRLLDEKRKDKYKLHPFDDYGSYRNFITHHRPVPKNINCGYIDPRKPDHPSLESKKVYNKNYAGGEPESELRVGKICSQRSTSRPVRVVNHYNSNNSNNTNQFNSKSQFTEKSSESFLSNSTSNNNINSKNASKSFSTKPSSSSSGNSTSRGLSKQTSKESSSFQASKNNTTSSSSRPMSTRRSTQNNNNNTTSYTSEEENNTSRNKYTSSSSVSFKT